MGAGRQRSALRSRQHYARLSTEVCDHAFRSTGITVYLENGDTLEKARRVKSARRLAEVKQNPALGRAEAFRRRVRLGERAVGDRGAHGAIDVGLPLGIQAPRLSAAS